MDVRTAAAELAVPPKRLRQFLRSDSRFHSPGTGGRYDLSEHSIEDIRAAYERWATPQRTPEPVETVIVDESDALPIDAPREAVRAHTAGRVARLETLLCEAGLSVSQMTDHPSWTKATTTRKNQRHNH